VTRLLAVPATISAIVVIPILVGQQRAEQPAAPNPREAALTLKLEGAEGMTQPLPLLIRASGAPPVVTTLKTADGLQTATVKPGTGCAGAQPRSTAYNGEGATEWCLVLSGVPAHGEVAGVVKATAAGSSQVPPTALALTVDHRDALRWWPAIAIAAGLLGSVLLTVFVNRLAASIRGNRLDQLLVQNRHATPRNRIVGLEQWVATRRELGDSDETLLAVVAPLTKNGPKKAREQRRQLRLALEQSSLPNDHPLAVSARAEVGRETHQVSDFVDESGNPQVHPADRLRAAIGMMDAFADQLQRLESEITNGLTKRCQEEPMRSLEQAKTWWQHQSSPDSFDRLAAALGDAEAALYAKRAGLRPAGGESRGSCPRRPARGGTGSFRSDAARSRVRTGGQPVRSGRVDAPVDPRRARLRGCDRLHRNVRH